MEPGGIKRQETIPAGQGTEPRDAEVELNWQGWLTHTTQEEFYLAKQKIS